MTFMRPCVFRVATKSTPPADSCVAWPRAAARRCLLKKFFPKRPERPQEKGLGMKSRWFGAMLVSGIFLSALALGPVRSAHADAVPAPDFTLVDLSGKATTLSAFK